MWLGYVYRVRWCASVHKVTQCGGGRCHLSHQEVTCKSCAHVCVCRFRCECVRAYLCACVRRARMWVCVCLCAGVVGVAVGGVCAWVESVETERARDSDEEYVSAKDGAPEDVNREGIGSVRCVSGTESGRERRPVG